MGLFKKKVRDLYAYERTEPATREELLAEIPTEYWVGVVDVANQLFSTKRFGVTHLEGRKAENVALDHHEVVAGRYVLVEKFIVTKPATLTKLEGK